MQDGFFAPRSIAYRVSPLLPGRPTLVFIHGLSGSSSAWYPFEHAFENYNILTYDLRGHGLSSRPRIYDHYSLREQVEDLRALLEHVGIHSCIIIGHSYGTIIGEQFALSYPTSIQALALINPVAFLSRSWSHIFFLGLSKLCARVLHYFPIIPIRRVRMNYAKFTYTRDWDPKRIIPDIYETSLHAYFYCMAQLYSRKLDTGWARISAPTLILHSLDDHIIPLRLAQKLAQHMPQAKLRIVSTGEHILVINKINQVIAAIQDFITEANVSSQS